MSARRERLIALLKERSLLQGEFVLSSGRRSSCYVDCRRTTMHAEGLALIGALGLEALRRVGWQPQAVGGMTLGADPVAYAIAAASHADPPLVHGFTVRKDPKAHGAGRRVEGCFEAGARVVVVEDVLTTGSSSLEAARAIGEAGGSVLGVLAVVDRGEGGREAIEGAGLALHALVALPELV